MRTRPDEPWIQLRTHTQPNAAIGQTSDTGSGRLSSTEPRSVKRCSVTSHALYGVR